MIDIKKPWTPSDVRRLASLYNEKSPLKIMARELERTPTAVNKALTRFNIRPTLEQLGKTNPKKAVKERRERDIACALTIDYEQYADPGRIYEQRPAIMDAIIQWLEDEGVTVVPFSHKLLPAYKYRVDKSVMTDLQLVLFANRKRLEERLPVFAVQGLGF